MKNDDKDSFIKIYNYYHKPLQAFISRFVKVPSYTEDILQDTFLKLWEIRKRVNSELDFKAYLYRIIRNLIYKYLKKVAADEVLLNQAIHQFQPDINQVQLQVEWKEYEKKVNEAILQLPPKRQIVFRMCREQNKSYDEVSKELGISRNTVKEHMVLAMKKIEIYLQANSGISLPLFALIIFIQK